MAVDRHIRQDSAPSIPSGMQRAAGGDKGRVIQVRMVLRPAAQHDHPMATKLAAFHRALPGRASALSPDEHRELRCPADTVIEQVRAFAQTHGLEVLEERPHFGDMLLSGPLAAMESAFGVEIAHYGPDGAAAYHAHEEDYQLPGDLADSVMGVLGLSGLPLVEPSMASDAAIISCLPQAYEEYYHFPTHVDGSGQRIAIIEFGGGYHPQDLADYFEAIERPLPEIEDHAVLGATNNPLNMAELAEFIRAKDDANLPLSQIPYLNEGTNTLEVTTDIQLVGAFANGAKIDVYFAPGNAHGFYEALTAALEDNSQDGDDKALAAISISWGWAESDFNSNDYAGIESALSAARARGITVCCSSGDYGSVSDSNNNKVATVQYPASSPNAMSCGGTEMDNTSAGFGSERVWNWPSWHAFHWGGGGGMSGVFALPDFQEGIGVPTRSMIQGDLYIAPQNETHADFAGRGVPDVAANAGMPCGYLLWVGGVKTSGFGTSAATPLWASLLARLQQALGPPLGFLPQHLHTLAEAKAVTGITQGNNKVADTDAAWFSAQEGWNACTGWGSPLGTALLDALSPSNQDAPQSS